MFRSLRSLVAPVILFSLSATLYPGAAFASASFTNWAKTGGSWYYLEPSGDMATGCLKDNSKWYYWSESGAMTIGWEQIGGSWYLFDGAGWMTTCWQKVGKVSTTWMLQVLCALVGKR